MSDHEIMIAVYYLPPFSDCSICMYELEKHELVVFVSPTDSKIYIVRTPFI